MFKNLIKINNKRLLINPTKTNRLWLTENTNSFRTFSNFTPIKQENNSDNTNNDVTFKSKKPLSRVPIGGANSSTNPNAKNEIGDSTASGSIEFSTWKAATLFIVVGATLSYFFNKEKKRLEIEREAESNRGYGKPLIGGKFELTNSKSNEIFTEKDLLGKWSLIYFGFTHCPDICPDELDKLGVWLNTFKKQYGINLQPIFITCDPARDSPEVISEYLKDFHEDIIGLTGDYDAIKDVCKKYRVYFSTPPDVKPGQEYLVDHSVFFYLMDPEGNFAQVLGLNSDETTGVENIKEYIDTFVPTSERNKREQKWYSFLFN